MLRPIRTCALVGKFQDPRVAESATALVQQLLARQLRVIAPSDAAPGLPAGVARLELPALLDAADLMISIGGDGTLLYAAGLVAPRDIPLLGINRGRLGFLTDVLPQEIERSVEALLAGECQADRRPLLQSRLIAADGRETTHFALNDVVFNRLETGRMLDFETSIDDRHLNTLRRRWPGCRHCDRLDRLCAVLWRTHCRAAARRAGDCADLPPYPQLSADRRARRRAYQYSPRGPPRDVGAGDLRCHRPGRTHPGGRVEISPAGHAVTLLHPPGYDYFRLLRSKLHWGMGDVAHER